MKNWNDILILSEIFVNHLHLLSLIQINMTLAEKVARVPKKRVKKKDWFFPAVVCF